MRNEIQIGKKRYSSKKEALDFYKRILNSYNYGERLNSNDFNFLLDLIEYGNTPDLGEEFEDEFDDNEEISITHIVVAKVQYGTKCFAVFYSDLSNTYISYRMIVNRREFTASELFYIACRNIVQADITRLKQDFFKKHAKKGFVKCQETGIPSKWEELVVDHRQPNPFSMIVERFKELTCLNISEITYVQDINNLIVFENEDITSRFRTFHNEKAALRIVRKECNSGRAFMGRVKKTSKDLSTRNPQGELDFDLMKDELTEAMHGELSISPEDELMFRVFTALEVMDIGYSQEEVMEMYNVTQQEIHKYEPKYRANNE